MNLNKNEIINFLGKIMLEQSNEDSFWSGRALSMIDSLLSILIPLKDAGLLFTPEGERSEVLSFSLLRKWIADENIKKLYHTINVSNKIINSTYKYYSNGINMFKEEPIEYIHGCYSEYELEYKIFDENKAYEYFETEKDKLKLPFGEEDYKKFRKLTYKKNEQINKGIDINRLENYLTSIHFNLENEFSEISLGSRTQHGNSFVMWREIIDIINDKLPKLFDIKFGDINIEDCILNLKKISSKQFLLNLDPKILDILEKSKKYEF